MIAMVSLAIVLLVIAYLAWWPVRIRPVAWTPPPTPSFDDGPYARNGALAAIERLSIGEHVGPETVTRGPDGALYAGVAGGAIVRVDERGAEVWADTGGRPDGIAFADDGALWVCDCYRGLLRIDPRTREVAIHATEASGEALHFANDLALTRDAVYFTDSSDRFQVHEDVLDLLEHGGNGRLCRHDRASGETTVVRRGLQFANGVALGPDDEYLLVVETGAYRVQRLWLRGARSGQWETFADNLPGFPDNIRYDRARGLFWLAIASPRDRLADRLLFPRPWLRKVLVRLPPALIPGPKAHAIVLAFDREGRLIHNLQDDGRGCFRQITCVEASDDVLLIGSFRERAIGRLRVPTRDAAASARD